MFEFIQGDDFQRTGGVYEEKVWASLKESLKGREILAYSKYPLFIEAGRRRKEPDIIALDKELGLIVIEVKGIDIDNIVRIENGTWYMENLYEKTISPFSQVENYGYDFNNERFNGSNVKLEIKTLVALPKITKSEFIEKGFDKSFRGNLDNIIFKDELTKKRLLEKLINANYLVRGKELDEKEFKEIMALLGHEDIHVVYEKSFVSGRKGEIANAIKEKLYNLDIEQEKIAKTIAIGPQRIRGIAGSGKTLLLCQKAANMYLKNPEYKIAVTFFTQSLYETIEKNLDKYLRAFSNNEVGLKDTNIKVFHAWGRKAKDGLYSKVAKENVGKSKGVAYVNAYLEKLGKNKKFNDEGTSINVLAKTLFDDTGEDLKELYDAILIDEGQDLIGDDEFKYREKQSFYYMAYKSIKPTFQNGKEYRKIIWAYDELQSLNDTKKPSGKELFGISDIVKGNYKGNIQKSIIMKKCYRTPYDILTTAHAVGMGFFRKEGMLTGYTTKKDWEDIGYEVKAGDFRGNKEIILERPKENNPNPIHEIYKGECLDFSQYNSNSDMIRALGESVKRDIEEEGLKPDRDILIITLDKYNKIKEDIKRELSRLNIDWYIPASNAKNYDNEKPMPEKFWSDGAVTISGIRRAKGNEAIMVYVLGLDHIAKNEGLVSERNKLFTAMTRAKCFLKIMAVSDDYSLYEEIKKAKEAKGSFKFKFIRPKNNVDDDENE